MSMNVVWSLFHLAMRLGLIRCKVGRALGPPCGRRIEYRQRPEWDFRDVEVTDWSYYCERHTGWPMRDVTATINPGPRMVVETLDGEDVTEEFEPPDDYLEEYRKHEAGEPNRFREMNRQVIRRYDRGRPPHQSNARRYSRRTLDRIMGLDDA